MYFRILSNQHSHDVKYTCNKIKANVVEAYKNTRELTHIADYCKHNMDKNDSQLQQQCLVMFEQACKLNNPKSDISLAYRELKKMHEANPTRYTV